MTGLLAALPTFIWGRDMWGRTTLLKSVVLALLTVGAGWLGRVLNRRREQPTRRAGCRQNLTPPNRVAEQKPDLLTFKPDSLVRDLGERAKQRFSFQAIRVPRLGDATFCPGSVIPSLEFLIVQSRAKAGSRQQKDG